MNATTPGAHVSTKQANKGARTSRLLLEIERYLAAVECFRQLGYEPHWRAEAR
jgi:hypothetical protein